MKTAYLLDTSVIVHDPEILSNLEQSKIIIPMAVLEELDKLKSQYTIVGSHARQFLKILDNLNITKEITLDNGSILALDINDYVGLGHDKSYGDNKILACAVSLNVDFNKEGIFELIVLSRDYNLRIRSRALGINAKDYAKDNIVASEEDLYTGTKTIETDDEEINSFYLNGVLCLDSSFVKKHELCPNQFVILKNEDGSHSAACRFYEDMTLRPLKGNNKAFGLSTKNKEQAFALELLFDDNVKLVTLSGMAGTGKTLMAVAAGLDQVINEKKYEKFLITKSIETVGKDIGALPGTKLEKMAPFIQSIMDNVATLFSKSKKKIGPKKNQSNRRPEDEVIQDPYLALLLENGVLEVEALAYMRGRSIDNAFILLDEGQNLTQSHVKTILTRAGHNTKIVITSDLNQIDAPGLNIFNNGATYVIDKFKGESIAGHVTLTKGERSELATISAKIL
jgi:PhoH-like ATPase